MRTTPTELFRALSLMRRAREACAARLDYTKTVWRFETAEVPRPSTTLAAPPRPLAAAPGL